MTRASANPFRAAQLLPGFLAFTLALTGCELLRQAPGGNQGGAEVLDELPDEDFVSNARRDIEEQENERDAGDFEPESEPREIKDPSELTENLFGEVLDDQIRAATLNLHLLTRNTARRKPEGQAAGRSEDRIQMLFRILDEAKIAIIALQEVYVVTDYTKTPLKNGKRLRGGKVIRGRQRVTDHPLFAFPGHSNGRFRVFPGEPTKESERDWTVGDARISMTTREYLPIIVDTQKVSCTDDERTRKLANDRFIHILVRCEVVAPTAQNKFDFSFASTHLSWTDDQIGEELAALGNFLPGGGENGGLDADFLIGGDFNSSSSGHLAHVWAGLPRLVSVEVDGRATKWVRRPNPPPPRFFVNRQRDRRHLDDIVFFEPTTEDYVPDSKKVLPMFPKWFDADVDGMNGYATFSDHFPVIADFFKDRDTD
jgi:hypothetical protein